VIKRAGMIGGNLKPENILGPIVLAVGDVAHLEFRLAGHVHRRKTLLLANLKPQWQEL
jgi:hypothetical protein